MRIICIIAAVLIMVPSALFAVEQTITVGNIEATPVIDGDLTEWGEGDWSKVPVVETIKDDKDNFTGNIEVDLKVVQKEDIVYIAAKWPDSSENILYKRWIWRGKKYKRGKKLDDMFALRFHLSGNYDPSMLTEKTYKADVWLWSAGRSNASGYANDMWHLVTTKMLEDAAEYKLESGKIVFIRKKADSGTPAFENAKPRNRKKHEGDKLPSTRVTENPEGSVADVQAKGVWKDGYWQIEMSRKMNTGNDDDTVFEQGKSIIGAIAVFNRAEMEHKSASGNLIFQF